MRKLLVTLLLIASAAAQLKYDRAVDWNLPDTVLHRFESAHTFEKYDLSDKVNPFYLRGDFDGDGKPDYAVLVKAKSDGKTRLAICLSTHVGVDVLGPGGMALRVGTQKQGYDMPDFDWMDVWQVRPKVKLTPTNFDAPQEYRPMSGEALLVEKTESASALIYWDGSKFRWYQVSD